MAQIEVSEGVTEGGIVVGNNYDKYGSSNPIVTYMMRGFETSLDDLLARVGPGSIHEIGCGEGRWSLKLMQEGRDVVASDFSQAVIDMAKRNASAAGLDGSRFSQKSIYDMNADTDMSDITVCCEVLEHLEDPQAGLDALHRVTREYLICSVPREPIWLVLNMARGKYLTAAGNTPGHLQHWSKTSFKRFIGQSFDIVETRTPLPWTMSLCKPKLR